MSGDGPLIFIVAGEPSGDALGARLMAALKERTQGAVRFAGIGGERMAGEGLDSLLPIRELSVMGYLEVVPKIPRILGHDGAGAVCQHKKRGQRADDDD